MFSLVATAHAAESSIKLTPYVVGDFFGVPITATLLTTWLALFIILLLAWAMTRKLALLPGKLQSVGEVIVGGAHDQLTQLFEDAALARKYTPIILTIFIYILVMNWLGLMPGVTSIGFYEGHGEASHLIPFLYPPATDLNITLAFAIVSFLVIEFAGISALGVWKYGSKFINLRFLIKPTFQNFIGFFVGIIELISEIARLLSFSFRLFGNIFAGKVLLTTIMALLIPYVVPVPILAYELIVGLIQASVFALLTAIFIKIAVDEPH